MTDQDKKEFVREQMANHHTFITLALENYHGHGSISRALPDSIREYTETFMQQLTFMLRLL